MNDLIRAFMELHYTLPFGNGGRGTAVYLWPFVGVGALLTVAWLIDNYVRL